MKLDFLENRGSKIVFLKIKAGAVLIILGASSFYDQMTFPHLPSRFKRHFYLKIHRFEREYKIVNYRDWLQEFSIRSGK